MVEVYQHRRTNEEIVEAIRNGDSVHQDLELLYTRNEPIIRIHARRYANERCEVEDLMQEAYFALLAAVENWEPAEGVKFITYASYYFRAFMLRYSQECCGDVRVPKYMGSLQGKYLKYESQWYMKHGTEPKISDMAKVLDISEAKAKAVKKSIEAVNMMRLDAPVGTDSEEGVGFMVDTIADPADPIADVEDRIQNEQLHNTLDNALGVLTDRQRQVIIGRFYEGKTLEELSAEMGVNFQRVRQIQQEALRRIRNSHWPKRLRPYLISDGEAYSEGLKGSSFNEFRYTGRSSVERVIMKHYGQYLKVK